MLIAWLASWNHATFASFLIKLVATEVSATEPAHHLQPTVIRRELALHEELRVFTALSPELHLSLVHWLETCRELRLALVAIQGSTCVLSFTRLHTTSFASRLIGGGARAESRLVLDS